MKAGCLLKSSIISCRCCFHLLFTSVKPENCKNDSKIKWSSHLSLSLLLTAHPCLISKAAADDMGQGALQPGNKPAQLGRQLLPVGLADVLLLLEHLLQCLALHIREDSTAQHATARLTAGSQRPWEGAGDGHDSWGSCKTEEQGERGPRPPPQHPDWGPKETSHSNGHCLSVGHNWD